MHWFANISSLVVPYIAYNIHHKTKVFLIYYVRKQIKTQLDRENETDDDRLQSIMLERVRLGNNKIHRMEQYQGILKQEVTIIQQQFEVWRFVTMSSKDSSKSPIKSRVKSTVERDPREPIVGERRHDLPP
jgi:hypothetical protein